MNNDEYQEGLFQDALESAGLDAADIPYMAEAMEKEMAARELCSNEDFNCYITLCLMFAAGKEAGRKEAKQ